LIRISAAKNLRDACEAHARASGLTEVSLELAEEILAEEGGKAAA
jgi:hypothetical protein